MLKAKSDFLQFYKGLHSVVDNVLDCFIIVNKFEV